MPNRILPREGFRADFVGSILRNTVFDPVKTLLVILLFQHAPPSAAAYLPRQREAILKWLRVALALSLVRKMNSWLGRRAINRGTGDKYDWPREVIVVTGGSNGFGKQLVLMLAERARSRIAILDVITPDYTLPAGVKYFRCDITSTEAIAAAAVDIRAEFGEPTILINNAGIIYARPLLENTDREIQKMFEVNTLAQYKLLHQFLPDIVKRNHGMIVTIASQGGNCTTPGMTAYCASKAASINLHEGLTSELVTRYNAPRVRTVLVTPAFAKTFVTRDMIPEDSFLSPLLEPETVAEAVVDQVLKGQSGYVGVSASANWFTFNLRSMPLWYQTGLRDRLDRTVRVPEQKHAWVQRDE